VGGHLKTKQNKTKMGKELRFLLKAIGPYDYEPGMRQMSRTVFLDPGHKSSIFLLVKLSVCAKGDGSVIWR
jgi:hypothetical protein